MSWFLGFVGGVGAWFVTNLAAQPLLRFWTLRSEAAAALSYHRNVGPYDRLPSSMEVTERDIQRNEQAIREAQHELRVLASRLHAFFQTEWIARRLAWLGYDVREAAHQMFNVSNTIGIHGMARADAQRGIRIALRLRDRDES